MDRVNVDENMENNIYGSGSESTEEEHSNCESAESDSDDEDNPPVVRYFATHIFFDS